jgi:autotransporter passenger strand-loop-strand repeat protein
MVGSGSEEIIFSGASGSSTTVDAGGLLIVGSGGVASATTISGGFVELGGGNGTGGGLITFAGGGELKLDQSTAFTGQIAGFAVPDELDLADISFGAGTTLSFTEAGTNTSGTLTVSDGTHTALGQYTTGQFHITSDGAGGSLVTDPPLAMASDPSGGGVLWVGDQGSPTVAQTGTAPLGAGGQWSPPGRQGGGDFLASDARSFADSTDQPFVRSGASDNRTRGVNKVLVLPTR